MLPQGCTRGDVVIVVNFREALMKIDDNITNSNKVLIVIHCQ